MKVEEEFFNNLMVQDAILRRLQTLTESTQRLSDDLKQNIIWISTGVVFQNLEIF